LIELVSKRLGIPQERLREGRMSELGLDSLDVVELAMELEEQLR
jgi:acyl carrier protein